MTLESRAKVQVNSGFTLLEVMLSLVILSYVVACIYPCLIYTIDVKDRVENMSTLNKVGQAIIRQITHDLEGCYDIGDPDVDDFAGIEDGETDSINFVTTVESAPDENGVRSNITEVGYRVEPSEQESDYYVLLRREGFFVQEDPLKGGTLSEVFDRVKSFNLTYHDGKEWIDGWNCKEKGRLPLAVKIEFVIKIERELSEGEEKEQEAETEKQEGYFCAIVTLPTQYGNILSAPPQP